MNTVLNRQLANWSVLYFKMHHFHWFVKGDRFFELHQKFEEFYNEAASNLDQIAELLLAKGGSPISTMREFVDQATVKEATGNETTEQMVQQVIQDFKTILKESEAAIKEAENAGDAVTADLFTDLAANLEKHIWMLTAYLAK
ncbi:Dps family protein [Thermoactinomyces mirandus]|uniref:Dps family protein n=1 Tax=Thermoactinomyces mirandus TaxID=2756294 RepID=UPI0028A5BAE4|nr:DNA starvation/stationary phase protection protein [Thermoactinomyces mirandus]